MFNMSVDAARGHFHVARGRFAFRLSLMISSEKGGGICYKQLTDN